MLSLGILARYRVTCDTWNVTHGGGRANFSKCQLPQCLEDSEQKDHLMN